jgi:transcriptional regulator with XRE-family HTH domain
MKDRLLNFLKEQNLSATRFADEIGVQRSSISHILSGRNKPSYDFIYKTLDRYSNINAEWLINGKGNMYKPEVSHEEQDITGKDLFSDDGKTAEKGTDEGIIKEKTKETQGTDIKESPDTDTGRNKPSEVKSAEKILIIYSDGTFREYSQGE